MPGSVASGTLCIYHTGMINTVNMKQVLLLQVSSLGSTVIGSAIKQTITK